MPPLHAKLRLTLGQLFAGTRTPSATEYHAVPVTVRADTADGADVRLIVEVRVDGGALEPHDLDRFVHAVTIPATRHRIEGHDLDRLQAELGDELHGVAREIREPLTELGITLLDVELVSAEHLLSPPAAAAVDGPG
jgi:hypothetical protein